MLPSMCVYVVTVQLTAYSIQRTAGYSNLTRSPDGPDASVDGFRLGVLLPIDPAGRNKLLYMYITITVTLDSLTHLSCPPTVLSML